jgi:ubiquinone/menaquinone biosynthesis C-methylase UbiE
MLRFPVFWEDDIHFSKGIPFDFGVISGHLDSPGLKVFNVHPFHFAMNTPDADHYVAHKHLNENHDDQTWRNHVFPQKGTRTFVKEVLDYVKRRNYRTEYLYDLYIQSVQEQHDETTFYRAASTEQKASIVRGIYDQKDSDQIYATSRDFNLRELEISFIEKHLIPGDVLDIGCGNGYTLLRLASKIQAKFIGIDFSPNMIDGAKRLTKEFSHKLKCVPSFRVGDVRQLSFENDSFDCVISERCLLNLPSREDQYHTIREVHRVLRNKGVYLMVEGTEDGLIRLNKIRESVGLSPIPSVSPDNVSSLKFHEREIEHFLGRFFDIEVIQFFGTYYLISRVVHPLLIYPEEPKFDAKINYVARKVAEVFPDVGKLGHVLGYKLVAKK